MNRLETAAVASALGYGVAWLRHTTVIENWGQAQVARRTRPSQWSTGASLLLLAAAYALWILHPLRSAANRRSWRSTPPDDQIEDAS